MRLLAARCGLWELHKAAGWPMQLLPLEALSHCGLGRAGAGVGGGGERSGVTRPGAGPKASLAPPSSAPALTRLRPHGHAPHLVHCVAH